MILRIQQMLYSFLLVFITATITKYLVDTGLIPFYDLLEKPVITPHHHYFRYIWNGIYILLFVGFYLALRAQKSAEQASDLHALFVMSLFLQVLWTYSFFYLQQIGISVAVIIILDLVSALLMHTLLIISWPSFFLILPYFIWLLFATYLNVFIALLN